MPAMLQAHRTWGTRYDSLVDAAPISSSSPLQSVPNINNDNTNDNIHTPNHDASAANISYIQNIRSATNAAAPFPLHDDAAKERPHLPHSQSTHSHSRFDQLSNTTTTTTPTANQRSPNMYSPPSGGHAKMPHDASVFIASLPSHLSDSELQSHLTDHLSHHATIKHVKLIRDNRNSVCAFVQVQSAKQATELIERCNFSLFMDRQIRCERARAFRTLLVSWVNREDSDTSTQPLRLRRCRGSRFVQVTVGDDAFCSDSSQLPNYSLPRLDDPLSGTGAFFEFGVPHGDLETLKKLMEAFGPLEFMMPFDPKLHQADGEVGDMDFESNTAEIRTSDKIEYQHVDSQTEAIAEKWAIKWEHRNDAVSALITLQSINNLSVCWCHVSGRSSAGPTGGTGYISNPSSPYRPTHHTALSQSRPRTFSEYGNQWYNGNGNGYQHKQHHYYNQNNNNYNQNSGRGRFNGSVIDPVGNKSVSLPLSFSESDFPPLNGGINMEANGIPGYHGAGADMGYMGDTSMTPRKKDVGNCGVSNNVWNGRPFIRSSAPSPSPPHSHLPPPPLSFSRQVTQVPAVIIDDSNTADNSNNNNNNNHNMMSDKINFFGQERSIPLTPDTPDLELEAEGGDGSASGVDMSPLTPGFPEVPHTPRFANMSHITLATEKLKVQSEGFGKPNGCMHVADNNGTSLDLQGLQSADGGYVLDKAKSNARHQNAMPKPYNHSSPNSSHYRRNSYDQGRHGSEDIYSHPDSPATPPGSIAPVVSDKELFVGNLKADGWSEERLRGVFDQYGTVEDLKLVKPGYHAPTQRRAFAFVRYVDGEAAQKAIQGQHLCSYDGHKMKVQLRDIRPNSRRSQWNQRTRGGRYNQGQEYSINEERNLPRNTASSPISPLPSSGLLSKQSSPGSEDIPKYPSITDPLSEEDEAALKVDFDRSDRTPPRVRSPSATTTVNSLSSLTSLSLKSPEGPPRAGSIHRSTQSEPDVQTPPSLHNHINSTDAFSTYAPSSTGSAPASASSSYHSQSNYVATSWAPPYPLCAPVSQDYSHATGAAVPSAQAIAPDGSFPWMGMYRNVMPVVPWFNPPAGVELTSAPLRPTGYIQRDDIFIPVYPPERLGQYMSTTSSSSIRTENNEQQGQSPSSTSAPANSNGNATPSSNAVGLRTSPAQTAIANSSPSSWMTVNGTPHHSHHPQSYPSPMYHMPYVVPPHAMMIPPHLAHPNSQGQWMGNFPQPMIYPPAAGQSQPVQPQIQQQQQQQQQQQHIAAGPTQMAMNGYPFYYPQPTTVNGQPAHYSRSPYPGYYIDASGGGGGATVPGPVSGNGVQTQPQTQAQTQTQTGSQNQSYNQNNKPGNSHRREHSGHNSRINGGNSGRALGRRGNSLSALSGGVGGSNISNGNGNGAGTGMAPLSKGTNGNSLPIQVTASY